MKKQELATQGEKRIDEVALFERVSSIIVARQIDYFIEPKYEDEE